nr:OCIA domain-containing protein 2 [Pogona vitticeps]XP_020645325.1 OCIA domain-containing protein 2 [Pogona vitticeps]XP_020645327.1 OCIA domain-containing protein 2 [Pogona vitticeps]XP_020645328.1 OCIA domain-containing protein 2 [Pogona vitticeps]
MAMAPASDIGKVEASPGERKDQKMHCPISNVNTEEIAKIRKQCREESFWYRALPLSLGSMLVVQGLVANGILKPNPRLGPFPKMALAGVLGYAVGTMSYIRICMKKFESAGAPFFGKGQKWHCHHTCEQCQAKLKASPSEKPETSVI